MVYPAHHGNFWVGGLPGLGQVRWPPKTWIFEKVKWAWEALSGIRTPPYPSVCVRTLPSRPYDTPRTHTEGFGNVVFSELSKLSELFRTFLKISELFGPDGCCRGQGVVRTFP